MSETETTWTWQSLADLTAKIITAYVSNNQVSATELAKLTAEVRDSLAQAPAVLAMSKPAPKPQPLPAFLQPDPPKAIDMGDRGDPTTKPRLVRTMADKEPPPPPAPLPIQKPAVPIEAAVTPTHIFCLECGRKLATMRNHLRKAHDLTPPEYRRKWSLSADFPMVAADFLQKRSDIARRQHSGKRNTVINKEEMEQAK